LFVTKLGKYLPYLGKSITELGKGITELGGKPIKNGKVPLPIFDTLLCGACRSAEVPILKLFEPQNSI